MLGRVLLNWIRGSTFWILTSCSSLILPSLLTKIFSLHASLDPSVPTSLGFFSLFYSPWVVPFLPIPLQLRQLFLFPFYAMWLSLHLLHVKILAHPCSAITYRSAYHLSLKLQRLCCPSSYPSKALVWDIENAPPCRLF